jgi:predicted Rossmann fold flavoprotein
VLKTSTEVTAIKKRGDDFVVETNVGEVAAQAVIVTTGGLSRPETGSTGDGFRWLAAMGHTIVTPSAALVPIATSDRAKAKKLAGVSLQEAGIKLLLDDVLVEKRVGKVLFTHVGLSGPGILNLSQKIGAFLTEGAVTVALDLLPHIPTDELDVLIKNRLMESSNKQVQNQWHDLIPTALVAPILEQAAVDGRTRSHSVTVPMRRAVVAAIKTLPFRVSHLLGTDKAVVTSGGVALTEIDFRRMESKLVPGLYVAGDILNINRPSGGYSLQLSWTTGYVAGMAASRQVRDGEVPKNQKKE